LFVVGVLFVLLLVVVVVADAKGEFLFANLRRGCSKCVHLGRRRRRRSVEKRDVAAESFSRNDGDDGCEHKQQQ
jgi:hypothetical protein